MPTQKGKITVRQALILSTLATFSPAIRLYAAVAAEYAGQAAWVSPLVSALAMLLLFEVWNAVFQNREITSLGVFFERALGKAAGRVS